MIAILFQFSIFCVLVYLYSFKYVLSFNPNILITGINAESDLIQTILTFPYANTITALECYRVTSDDKPTRAPYSVYSGWTLHTVRLHKLFVFYTKMYRFFSFFLISFLWEGFLSDVILALDMFIFPRICSCKLPGEKDFILVGLLFHDDALTVIPCTLLTQLQASHSHFTFHYLLCFSILEKKKTMTKSRNWIIHFEVRYSGVEASSKMQRGQNYKSFHL